jgi:putative intracellular protease/amidase
MKRIVEESKKKRVLNVVTSHETLGKTGYPTGLWLSELTHPYFELAYNGIDVEVAKLRLTHLVTHAVLIVLKKTISSALDF